jgi:DNA-binding IclR family transcriptional regulator
MSEMQMLSRSQRAVDVGASVVKSAGRALRILEYFDLVQREACVSEISRALQCPQSSTSVLLRSLVSLGYLQNDRYRRTYYPTRRVCLLGNWVDPTLVRQGELLMRATELARQTQQTVTMATINGLQAQYIYVNRSQNDPAPIEAFQMGMQRSLVKTALGKALLAAHGDDHISRLIWRMNGECSDPDSHIHIPTLLSELRRGRDLGWFTGEGSDSTRCGIAIILGRKPQLLSIGIEHAGAISKDQELSYSRLLKNLSASPVAHA